MAEQKKSFFYKALRFVWRGIVAMVLIGIVATIGFAIYTSTDLPPLSDLENPQMDLSSQIYTSDGELIGNFHHDENRIFVEMHEISPYVQDALIATEDIRFYDHCGIDAKTMALLVARNLLGTKSGGSTLTMQLSRNLYDQVGRERTIVRKVKEMIVSAILEQKFTKTEIMQAYLNTAGFYGNTYGIEMGAKTLFSKPAKDLELHEAALMVGLLKGPTYYNPRTHEDRAIDRRNVVISQMEKYGFIDAEERDSVQAMGLELRYRQSTDAWGIAPYFRMEVKKWLEEWCDDNNMDPYSDGLKIYTTVDSRMQRYAEEAVHEHLATYQKTFDEQLKKQGYPWVKDPSIIDRAMEQSPRWKTLKKAGKSESRIKKTFREEVPMRVFTHQGMRDTVMTPRDSIIHYLKFLETGFVSIDPTTGHIKAWVGGIDFSKFQYDHVSQGKRQVGSTFKPFVYAAAMDNGRLPCDVVLNQQVFFDMPGGKTWAPQNSGGKVGGKITLKDGLAGSLNVVTARLMKDVGVNVVCDYAHEIGIESDLDCVPSLCLGTTDLSVLEMAGAYSTFANKGTRNEPTFIQRIEDKNGNVLYEYVPEKKEVLSPRTAYLVCTLLMGVVDSPGGTAHSLRTKYKFPNQIGGKTGTTQNNSDGWFMGITPNLVSGVWVGCSDRRVRFKSTYYGQGAKLALPIWAIYMQKVYGDASIGLPADPFQKPEGFDVDINCAPPKEESSTTDPTWPGTEDDDGPDWN